jgi:arylsulfatase A-like enzyme/Flp pilus assembly protein TadD
MRYVLIALTVLLLLGCPSRDTPLATTAPAGDIILVTIDTWRADAAGFAGNVRVKTPFLDSLAARGVVFTNAHAHNVVTLPSHVNILTGLNPYEHGVRENGGYVLDAKVETLAERLQKAGYATGAFIAAFPLDARYGLNQGFDAYDDNYGKGRTSLGFTVQERNADAVLSAAKTWWQSVTGRKRFLWVHLYEPHAPYMPPEPFAGEYRDRPYLGEVAYTDHVLQTQLAPLIANDTTLIVTSDHGEALGDHGELTHGLFAYESTLKVPLIVVAPGVAARKEAAYARHIDIAPTILERAAIEAKLPGQSLLQPMKAADTYFEALSTALNRGWAPLTGLIRDQKKFIDLPVAELYDLTSDPAEIRNLYATLRRESAAARTALEAIKVAPDTNRNISSEEAARLRSLGYFTGSSSSGTAEDPKNLVHIDAKMHRIIELYELDKREEAVRVAREVVAAQPKMNAGRELLAFVLQETDRVDEAITVLRGIPSDAAKVQLALLLSERGDAAEAVKVIEPQVKEKEDADVLNAYGIALAQSGRSEAAVQQFRRALQIDPNNAPAFQNLGIESLRNGDIAGAEAHLSQALQLNPRLPLALNTLGVVHIRKGDAAKAEDAWRRAFELDRRQYDALFNLALIAAQRGDEAASRRALQEFVRIAPPSRYANELARARAALAR